MDNCLECGSLVKGNYCERNHHLCIDSPKKKLQPRETSKWITLFNERLKELVKEKGLYRLVPIESDLGGWGNTSIPTRKEDVMPDRIKEAEEYADRLYEAMR